MIRSSRVVSAAMRMVVTMVVLDFGPVLVPPPASAALGDCGQPVTNGPAPTATDCLYILNVAISLATCSPASICAPKGSLPTTATDALVCLGHVVGQSVPFNCPSGTSSTTSTTASTTTTSTTSTSSTSSTSATTTSTNTTTTTLLEVLCTIDTAPCTTTACSCGELPGLDYHLGATGGVFGPVGTQLRVNTQLQQGGVIDCGAWTKIDATVNASCDTIGCCQREAGQPEQTDWAVFENFDLPCFCPNAPAPLEANYVAQCQLGTNPPIEYNETTDPCP